MMGLEQNPDQMKATTKARCSEQGVNFTKASCSLYASAKIYSYHVNDAHLTSYEVLVTLSRADSVKGGCASNDAHGDKTQSSNMLCLGFICFEESNMKLASNVLQDSSCNPNLEDSYTIENDEMSAINTELAIC